ncbi:MAG: hypothetical protein CMO55_19515 [Verrucomicrobiales bacterium]|nr:hypothetical protein [Verrucomicrobiales bacterium]
MAKSFELEGVVKQIDDVQTFASGFSKREFVVEVEDGKFPQMIKFECLKDKTSLTDGFKAGDPIKVHFDIRGNEYNGRFYVNLNAWRLERPGGAEGSAEPNPAFEPSDGDAPPSHLSEPPGGYGQEDDDIPF